jgi:hypothetical protein
MLGLGWGYAGFWIGIYSDWDCDMLGLGLRYARIGMCWDWD